MGPCSMRLWHLVKCFCLWHSTLALQWTNIIQHKVKLQLYTSSCHYVAENWINILNWDNKICSLVVGLNVWGWKRMEWLCHHYLESARNAAAKLGLSALSSSTIAQPTFLLVPADNSGQLPRSTQVNLFLNLPSHCLIPLISPPFPR